jgi:hypothetical protein
MRPPYSRGGVKKVDRHPICTVANAGLDVGERIWMESELGIHLKWIDYCLCDLPTRTSHNFRLQEKCVQMERAEGWPRSAGKNWVVSDQMAAWQ